MISPLKIGHLMALLVFSLPLTTGAQPRPLVDGTLIRLPLIEGKDMRFTHLSTGQGLSQSRADHMLQDRRGFIWMGTYNGLNRYDGYRFKTYKPDPNNPNSLGGALVLPLFEDRSGILWIGVDAGLDRFDPTTERFTHFRIDPNNPDSPSGELEHINQDRDGMLWLATHKGLDRLDPASGRFTHYRNDPSDPYSLSSSDVRFVLEDRQDTLWVATAAGIDVFDRRTGRVTRRYPNSRQPPLDRILEDRAGMLWVSATRRGGLASLDPKTGRTTRYTFFDEGRDAPGVRGCSDILEDQNGMLWLATNPDGVVKFDRKLRQFTRYRNDPANPTSLNSNEVLSLLEDHEGGIWVGTNGGGVNRFPRATPPFTVYRHEPGNPNSLAQGYPVSVFEDSQGMLWVGTEQLNRLDRKTGRYTSYRPDPANPHSITSGKVYAIAEDPDGVMWFGTWGGGLNRFDRKTGRFKAYRHEPANAASLSNDFILSLLIDRGGNLWAGTDDGLNRLDAHTGRFTVFRHKSGSIEHTWYRVLAEDTDGSIWMGTYTQGLQRLDVRTGEIVEYQNDPKIRGSLSNNRVNALCLDHRGTLWVGTQNGLNRFERNTGGFMTFGERDGLPNNAIEGILEDSAGNLWLGTGNGLSRFDLQARVFKNFYADDGLAGDEFSQNSVYHKSSRGEMFFGGVNGITAFYPNQVVETPYTPLLVLTDFRLFNDPVPIGGKSPLQKSIAYTDSLTLSHEQNIFTIEFSALSFASPARNRYRYRLEPLETDWNETDSSRRMATYTTLTPGEYVFRVQGSDNHGTWNLQGAAVRIEVLAPWWGTWWFRSISAIAVVLITLTGYRGRVRMHVRQLQREVKQLQDVINTIPAYVWSALPDGSVDFINRRWLDFSGFSLEQALGWGWEEAIHPEDRSRFVEAWRAAVASGNAMETEARVRRADGQYRWLLIRNVPLRDEAGNIVKWYGKGADIDDRKRIEQDLRQSEAYLAETQTLSHTGSWAFDLPSNKYVYVSEECIRMLELNAQPDWPTREAVSRQIHPEDWDRVNASYEKSIREKVDTSSEFRILLPSGTEKHVQAIRHPVLNEAGDVVKLVGTIVDITDRKRTEQERQRLRQLEADLAHINRVKMLGEMSASIAHEVNQPISGVVSNASAGLRWLDGEVPNLEEAREGLRRIVRDGKRAGEVIARIRALTRKDATAREKLDLNETIHEVLALVGDKAKKENVTIRTHFADDLSPVLGDRVQLQQVALNLVMNAIEAMSSVGNRARELEVTTCNLDADRVQVTVEDSGIGIDAQTIDKIFDSFYTTKPGGMGMGLSISRSILQAHGGRLWATANDGPGTSFHFSLPKYHEKGSVGPEPDAVIAIVDDDPSMGKAQGCAKKSRECDELPLC